MPKLKLDRRMVHVLRWKPSNACYGDVMGAGARGSGQSIYFRDPDGSLLELIAYVPQVSRAQRS